MSLARVLALLPALALVGAGPAPGQEQRDAAPWRPLAGRDAGAVGSCHRLDDDETVACLIVRCDPARGLELAYRHGDPQVRPHPTRFAVQAGRYRTQVTFTALSPAELVLPLAGREALLDAMARPGRADPMLRLFAEAGQPNAYSTAFELTRAGPTIARVRAACRR